MTNHSPNGKSSKTNDSEEQYAYTLGIQAYIYGFPWIYNAQLRWLWASLGGRRLNRKKKESLPWAPINSFYHATALASPKNTTGGSPNCDTLYSTAWLDVSDDPIVLSVPAVTDRYYCVEMVCMDADNFAYVGTRSTGVDAGNYLIAGPGWTGHVPKDVLNVLPRSRTTTIFLLGRTAVNNTKKEDLAKARKTQHQYRLTPLSDWPNTPRRRPSKVMLPYGLDYNDTTGAWKTMNESMTQNPPGLPPGIGQDQLLKLFATIGIGPNQKLDEQSQGTLSGLQSAAEDGLKLLKEMTKSRGKKINGWTYPPLDIGRAGQNSDFVTRAALQSLAGICAHDPVEAVYLNISEHDGQPLSGQYKYIFTFPKDAFPPYDKTKHGFWSVTMYNTDYNLVGPTNYTINSNYPEYKERDSSGGMTILIQSDDPGDLPKGSYWLKAPAPTKVKKNDTFFLIMRIYVPEPSVSATQTWKPPKIRRG